MGKPKALRNRDVVPSIATDNEINKGKKSHITFDEEDIKVDDSQQEEMGSTENKNKTGRSTKRKKDQLKDVDNETDDAPPEEIAVDNAEILKLRAMHDQMMSSFANSRKKRKKSSTYATKSNTEDKIGADKELADDVFDSDEDEEQAQFQTMNGLIVGRTNDDFDGILLRKSAREKVAMMGNSSAGINWKIDKSKKSSKKIGNIEVSVLPQGNQGIISHSYNGGGVNSIGLGFGGGEDDVDMIGSFQVSDSAGKFVLAAKERNPKVSYASFMKAKHHKKISGGGGRPSSQFITAI